MSLLGHEDAWAQWHAAMAGPRMHHAWLLTGKRGVGKAGFALAAARQLVTEDGVPQPVEHHPDILVLSHLPSSKEEEKKRDEGKPFLLKRSISVDQVRQLQQRLNTRPTLGSRRVVIIDPIDDLEKAASNALLKSLEEPPQGTFFVLVAHRPGRLLPTIRSRCRVLPFRALGPDEMATALAREAPQADAAARAAAIAAAAGSPGVALEFVDLDLAPLHVLMEKIVTHGDGDFKLRGKLADAIGARPSRERQGAVIELARTVVASRMTETPMARVPALVATNTDLAELAMQFPIYNFDPGLLVMEIGTLLAHLAPARGAA